MDMLVQTFTLLTETTVNEMKNIINDYIYRDILIQLILVLITYFNTVLRLCRKWKYVLNFIKFSLI